MSIASPFDSHRPKTNTVARRIGTAIRGSVQTTAFWLAVLAPLAYPVLLYGGVDAGETFALFCVIVLNVAALVLGRGYNRARS